MEVPTRDEFTEILKQARISKRLIRDVRYVPEEIEHSEQRDFLTVMSRSRTEGVMLFEGRVLPIVLDKRRANSRGRIEAIICDICATWQRGTNSASLTFKKSPNATVSYLVCADLECSLHVRDLTEVSKLSRAQLREHITPEARAERLRLRLKTMLSDV